MSTAPEGRDEQPAPTAAGSGHTDPAPVAFVTGAASGIGAAVALLAAERGARVAVVDADAAGAERVAAEATAAGAPGALALAADVRDERQVERALAETAATLGEPALVLANAGVEVNEPPHLLPLEQWQRVLDVNLTGAFLTARLAIRRLLAAGVPGSIVCTSSPAAFLGHAGGGNAAYAASKGGLSAMVRSLAIDYAGDAIRVNAVVPGATDTPLLTVGVEQDERARVRSELLDAAREQIPLRRMGEPAEIARAVWWLWSRESSYVTGSHLVVDGGLMAKSANTF
jgi:NAD(P)-dependent dehydrogenase (short-subunit alcohol dehydrogenase family)